MVGIHFPPSKSNFTHETGPMVETAILVQLLLFHAQLIVYMSLVCGFVIIFPIVRRAFNGGCASVEHVVASCSKYSKDDSILRCFAEQLVAPRRSKVDSSWLV
jgi:hypothetical protein